MSKIILINKKFILIFLFIIFSIIFLFFNIIFSESETFASNIPYSLNNEIVTDFDGDGNLDTLKVIKTNNSYSVKIDTLKDSYTLNSKTNHTSLLDIDDSTAIKIDSFDLSRDGIPEIIITGSKNKIITTYIFKWIDSDFKEIFSSNDNIFGVINTNNSQTPQIFYHNLEMDNSNVSSFIFNDSALKDLSFYNCKIPSIEIIKIFIDLIEVPYDLAELPNIFSNDIDPDTLSILWKLEKDKFKYTFQTAHFYDINWNELGSPNSIIWSISFKKSNLNNSDDIEELILNLTTDLTDSNNFLISNISIQN